MKRIVAYECDTCGRMFRYQWEADLHETDAHRVPDLTGNEDLCLSTVPMPHITASWVCARTDKHKGLHTSCGRPVRMCEVAEPHDCAHWTYVTGTQPKLVRVMHAKATA